MIQLFHFWVFIEVNENTKSKRYLHPYIHCIITYIASLLTITYITYIITYNSQHVETT